MTDALLDLSILSELERRLGRDRIGKVLAVQLTSGAELGQRLAVLEEAPDRMRIKALAHQMAGSSGSIGLVAVNRQAKALEDAAMADSEAELCVRMAALRACLGETQRLLVSQYPEIGGARPGD
jgi:HPt (histidine-containing phosphotransfer) domain-containing protein